MSDVLGLSDDDSMETIKNKIESTASNLILKRKLLISQRETYDNLRKQVNDKSKKVLVLLGDGYFVEKIPSEADDFLERRISSINTSIEEFSTKIDEANDTVERLKKLEGLNSANDVGERMNEEGLPFMDIQEELDGEDNVLSAKINNKVVSSHILQSKGIQKKVKEEKNETSEIQAPKNVKGEASKLLEVQEAFANSSGESKMRKQKSSPSNNIVVDIIEKINDDFELSRSETTEESPDSVENHVENKNSVNVDDKIDQITELLEDMEIIGRKKDSKPLEGKLVGPNELLEKIDNLKISPEDKFKLKSICIEEHNDLHNQTAQDRREELSTNSLDEVADKKEQELNSNTPTENDSHDGLDSTYITSTSTPKVIKPAIDENDLLELELLADDFVDSNETSIGYADDEEWDFEFEDEYDEDDEEDDDDLADELLYGNQKASFIGKRPSDSSGKNANDLFWEQVLGLRKKSVSETHNQDTDEIIKEMGERTRNLVIQKSVLKNKTSGSSNAKKKSVRFSKSLEINEIENISDELKNIVHYNQNFSRFKQERLFNKSSSSPESDLSNNKDISSSDVPISEFIVEKDIIPKAEDAKELVQQESKDVPKESILKKDVNIDNKISSLNPKVSKFKQMKAQNPANQNKISLNKFNTKPKKIELREVKDLTNQGMETIDRTALLNTSILENEDKQEMEKIEPKKVSRFEASRQSSKESISNKPQVHSYRNPVYDVVEIDTITEETNSESKDFEYENKGKKISRFKANIQEARDNRSRPEDIGTIKEGVIEKETENGHDLSSVEASNISIEPKDTKVDPTDGGEQLDIIKTTLDYKSLQDDVDTMAKAYVLGLYDDDIVTEGPVIGKIEDFEILNKMIESIPNKTENTRKTSKSRKNEEAFDPNLDEIGEETFDEDEDVPILVDEIIENDLNDEPEDLEDIENLGIEQGFINQEVITNYHKLRQKMIFDNNEKGFNKSQKELELEPIDEEGNPIKVSRFKAAKLNTK